MPKEPSFYEVLEVSPSATTAEIKTAYRKQALRHHPDKNGGSQEQFIKVGEAHYILSDASLRRQYDATLAQKARSTSWGAFGGAPPFNAGQAGGAGGFSNPPPFSWSSASADSVVGGEGKTLEELLREFREDVRARGMDADHFRRMMADPEGGMLFKVVGTLGVAADMYLRWKDHTRDAENAARKK
ncbi:DnaJ domain-containing protein [Geranomyces variabilis]|nr:DnaJ domain-containing protein [Geranomyces variabilis]KAJ3143075.1 mitochondrial protein import protein MAS5 [Geranomyces variabilis]